MLAALSPILVAFSALIAAAYAQDPPADPPASTPTEPAAEKPATPAPAPKDTDPETPRDVSAFNLGADGLALDGHDPVSYFQEGGGKPQKGDAKITLRFRGASYRFATKDHRDLFLADPLKYEPAYGGWCAYGMANGDKVEIDPESFLIVDGRLMLFFDGLFADTRAKWQEAGSAKLTPKADEAWKRFLAKKS